MTLQQTIAEYLKYTGQKGLDISAALIDCDGVLYDSMKFHTQAWVKLMKKNGIKCTRDEFYELEGMTGSEIIKMKFKTGAGKNITDDEARALYGVKTRYFHELGEAPVMPGASRVLQTLKDAGVDRILVTGSQQDTLLQRIENDFPGLFRTAFWSPVHSRTLCCNASRMTSQDSSARQKSPAMTCARASPIPSPS